RMDWDPRLGSASNDRNVVVQYLLKQAGTLGLPTVEHGTAVTGRALNRYNAWAAFGSGPRQRVFSPPSDVTPGGQPGSQFTWRMRGGSSTPSRWPAMSLHEQPNCTNGQRTRLH